MKSIVKHIRASVFGLVIIAFFLPFVVVSCPDQGRESVSGVQFAFGRTIKGSKLSSVTSDQRIKPQPAALIAFACAIAGVAFSYLLKHKQAFIACLIAATLGIVLLLVLRNQINVQAYKMASDSLKVRYQTGYWLATAGFIAAFIVTLAFNPSKKMSLLSTGSRRKKRR
jgi:hypothetical protein